MIARKMGAQQARSGACACRRPAPGLTTLLAAWLRAETGRHTTKPFPTAQHPAALDTQTIAEGPDGSLSTAPPALTCQRHPMRSFGRQLTSPAPFQTSLATSGAVCGGACGEAGPGGQWRRMALEHRKHHVFDVLRVGKGGSQVCM